MIQWNVHVYSFPHPTSLLLSYSASPVRSQNPILHWSHGNSLNFIDLLSNKRAAHQAYLIYSTKNHSNHVANKSILGGANAISRQTSTWQISNVSRKTYTILRDKYKICEPFTSLVFDFLDCHETYNFLYITLSFLTTVMHVLFNGHFLFWHDEILNFCFLLQQFNNLFKKYFLVFKECLLIAILHGIEILK